MPRAILCLCCVGALAAQTPGVPLPAVAGPVPACSGFFANDLFGLAPNEDDFRTVQFGLAGRWRERWLLAADLSVFTFRGAFFAAPELFDEGRLDQLTLSFGRLWHPAPQTVCALGAGLRHFGDLGGRTLQNNLHHSVGGQEVGLPYEDEDDTALTAWGMLSQPWLWPRQDTGGPRLGAWLRGAALVTSTGQCDADADLLLLQTRGRFAAWAGMRYVVREGYAFSPALAITADVEEGPLLVVGISAGPLSLEMNRNLETNFGSGRFTLHRQLDAAADAYEDDDDQDSAMLVVGTQIDHLPLVAQLVWWAATVRDLLGKRWRTGLLLQGIYGGAEGDQPSFYRREQVQITLGLDSETALTRRPWLRAFVNGGVGWRREGFRSADLHRSYYDAAAVCSWEIGLRLDPAAIRSPRRRTALGFSLSALGQVPLEDDILRVGPAHWPVNQPKVAFTMAFNGHVRF